MDGLVSSVEIDGASTATVAVRMPVSLAARIAADTLDADDSPHGDAIRDVAGEIANMIGGNLKGLLPGPSQLSIPIMGDGRVRELRLPPNPAQTTMSFDCPVGRFAVTVTIHGLEERDR